MTPYEAGSLWAQWVGSSAGVAAVVVAGFFGFLTYANDRRSRDTQQRATLAAASLEDPAQRQSVLGQPENMGRVALSVRHKEVETWLLVNNGPDVAYAIEIDGLTDLDKTRLLEVSAERASLAPTETKEFVLVSRLTLSGPANVVVSFRLEPGGPLLRRVVQVPAP